jgi:hypothetical protein
VLDPLLQRLESSGLGAEVPSGKIPVLAFADDLILLGRDQRECQSLLRTTERFLGDAGLSLNRSKCASFAVRKVGKSFVVEDPNLMLEGSPLPHTDAESSTAYLGMPVTSWLGVGQKDAADCLVSSVERARGLRLKPHEKIHLIRTYIIPKFLYRLGAVPPSVTVSAEALCVLSGSTPIDLVIRERQELYQLKQAGQLRKYNEKETKDKTLLDWQRRWETSIKVRETYRYFPEILKVVKRKRTLDLDKNIIQFLTGHGDFKSYLHGVGARESNLCTQCQIIETPWHVLSNCPLYEHLRTTMKTLLQTENLNMRILPMKNAGMNSSHSAKTY